MNTNCTQIENALTQAAAEADTALRLRDTDALDGIVARLYDLQLNAVQAGLDGPAYRIGQLIQDLGC